MFFGTCLLFLFTVCSCRRLCTLLGYDISSYKAKDTQWLEFLYYIEPIIKASTERTKFGPLLWTKLKQQVLPTPLTQETLYYLSAFWWTRQLRGVTGFSPSQEIYAVTFNYIGGKEKNKPPPHFPTEAECKGKNLRNAEWILWGCYFSYLPMLCLVLLGTFVKVLISSKFRKKPQHCFPLPPLTNSYFLCQFPFAWTTDTEKTFSLLFIIHFIFCSSWSRD